MKMGGNGGGRQIKETMCSELEIKDFLKQLWEAISAEFAFGFVLPALINDKPRTVNAGLIKKATCLYRKESEAIKFKLFLSEENYFLSIDNIQAQKLL